MNKGTKLNCITRRMYGGEAWLADSKGRNGWAARSVEWLYFIEKTASGSERGRRERDD